MCLKGGGYMRNQFLAGAICTGLFLTAVTSAFAAPYKAAENNPQVVAYYENGTHGIPSETGGNHEGIDQVKQNGNSGNFQAWFYGTFPAGGEGLHGDHDVWKISKDGTCPPNAILVPNANPGWGDYLVPGADYCVISNDFHQSK